MEGLQIGDDLLRIARQPLDLHLAEGNAVARIHHDRQPRLGRRGIHLRGAAGNAGAQVALPLHGIDERRLATLPVAAHEGITHGHAEATLHVGQRPVLRALPFDLDVQLADLGAVARLERELHAVGRLGIDLDARLEVPFGLDNGQHLVMQLGHQPIELHRVVVLAVLPAAHQRAVTDGAGKARRRIDVEAVVVVFQQLSNSPGFALGLGRFPGGSRTRPLICRDCFLPGRRGRRGSAGLTSFRGLGRIIGRQPPCRHVAARLQARIVPRAKAGSLRHGRATCQGQHSRQAQPPVQNDFLHDIGARQTRAAGKHNVPEHSCNGAAGCDDDNPRPSHPS